MRTPRETFGLDGSGGSWTQVGLSVLSGSLVLSGIAVVAAGAAIGGSSPAWIGGGAILLGALVWVVRILVAVRAARRERRGRPG